MRRNIEDLERDLEEKQKVIEGQRKKLRELNGAQSRNFLDMKEEIEGIKNTEEEYAGLTELMKGMGGKKLKTLDNV